MPVIPLARIADRWLRELANATGSAALAEIDGATLLGERAMLGGLRIPGRVSAGGGCRLYAARHGAVALNLVREDDRALLPALFADDFDPPDDARLAAMFAAHDAMSLVARGRMLGLAIAAENEPPSPVPACVMLTPAPPTAPPTRPARVLDLSALWAGPLAAHLLGLAGAVVTKVESRTRRDAMRRGNAAFFALLHSDRASIELDLTRHDGISALDRLIVRADIVIEAARPRALRHLGIDADAIVRATPGLTWITITGHGARGDAANHVGFGDDAGVAAGLGAALRRASGRGGFVGDAIADPLTGLRAAQAAWEAWASGHGGRIGVSMRGVAAAALAEEQHDDAAALDRSLVAWANAAGEAFPEVRRRAHPPSSSPPGRGRTRTRSAILSRIPADTDSRLRGNDDTGMSDRAFGTPPC